MRIRIVQWALPAGLVGLSTALAGTVTLVPVADTTLFEADPDNNLGADPTLVAGTTARGLTGRALIRFDLSTNVLSGSVVTAASLILEVTKAPGFGANASVFELRRMLVDWGEGDKAGSTGAPASAGDATWNARFFPAPLWARAGAAEGTEYATIVSGAVAVSEVDTYQVVSTSELVTDAQFWVDHPQANFGWLLRSQSESVTETARRFGSREDEARGPRLQVDYQPGSGLSIGSISLTKTNGLITWTGGQPPYRLESKGSLSETNWTLLDPNLKTNQVTFSINSDRAFFRIVGQ